MKENLGFLLVVFLLLSYGPYVLKCLFSSFKCFYYIGISALMFTSLKCILISLFKWEKFYELYFSFERRFNSSDLRYSVLNTGNFFFRITVLLSQQSKYG